MGLNNTNPTHTAKLAAVTDHICGVVPEIMELKFGCKCKINTKAGLRDNIYTRILFQSGKIITYKYWHEVYKLDYDVFIDKFKIIGRDIRCADVLRVLRRKYILDVNMGFYVDSAGWFYDINKKLLTDDTGSLVFWCLSQNALHLQSEALVAWLFDTFGLGGERYEGKWV